MADRLPPELSRLLQATDPLAREQAWTAFAALHTKLLLHAARTLHHEHDAAMDGYTYVLEALRQDDFRRLRAYAADGRSKFTTWLVVVTRRLLFDHYRGRYGRARDPDPDQRAVRAARQRLLDLVADEIDPDKLPHLSTPHPDANLRAQDLHGALESVLACLPPRDRLLLALRFEDDLSARDIASVLALPTPFHVYRRLKAVLDRLRAALRARGVSDAEP